MAGCIHNVPVAVEMAVWVFCAFFMAAGCAADPITTPSTSLTAADCPTDASKRVQTCFSQSGILSAGLKLLVDFNHIPQFCKADKSSTMDCLQENFDLCVHNPSRLALLRLQADPQASHNHLSYFCKNFPVVREEYNCTNPREVQMCIERVSIKLRNGLAALPSPEHLKQKLDLYCLYHEDVKNCFMQPTASGPNANSHSSTDSTSMMISDQCQKTRLLYDHLANATRYPYCDLGQLEQNTRLHDALILPEDDRPTQQQLRPNTADPISAAQPPHPSNANVKTPSGFETSGNLPSSNDKHGSGNSNALKCSWSTPSFVLLIAIMKVMTVFAE